MNTKQQTQQSAPDCAGVIKQHLIDPEICIRCDTCEATCPIDAITHNDDNYVVDVERCEACMDCIAPCPTGAIDNWQEVTQAQAFSIEDQFSWEELPEEVATELLADDNMSSAEMAQSLKIHSSILKGSGASETTTGAHYNSTRPPWSAAHAYTNLFGPKAEQKSITATVTGNLRVTEIGHEYDTHHIVLDFGSMPFPVLEGQSIGVIPPGKTADGKPHHARQYSVASPRNGERPSYNNLSLTIKRVLEDREGQPVKGVASNYMCDCQPGDKIEIIGPFGSSFLMPNHPRSNIMMICTGTGSAPMRAMTEWRRRLHVSGKFEGGKLMLFFGARTKEELPYFGPLKNLPTDFIDINFAFSRVPDTPKRYVQDVMQTRATDVGELMDSPDTYIYVCGLKSMEEGVLQALSDIATQAGLSWDEIGVNMKQHGRIHLETY